jgi:hypothetical protein
LLQGFIIFFLCANFGCCASAHSERDNLIRHYFHLEYSYAEIVAVLWFTHEISISVRHLKRLLRAWNLNRRISWSPLEDVFKAVKEELRGSGIQLGYKFLWHRLKIKYGLKVKRSVVLQMLRLLNSEGLARRKARRFQRRSFYCPGPNFVWHFDGYDKLKPFGFAIHGCIDGYSRRLMWLHVGKSNNDPAIIAEYYLACVENIGYTAQKLRCDLGTEATTIKHLHPFLVNQQSNACVLVGRSTANQRIEAWWSVLRKSVTNFWMNLFKDLRNMNLYNDANVIHIECLRYCFMEAIQSDLAEFVKQWNCHNIRRQRNSEMPAGKPDVMHFAPQVFGARSYEVPVMKEDAQRCRHLFGKPRSENTYLRDFEELAKQIVPHVNQPCNAMEALRLYFTILAAADSI